MMINKFPLGVRFGNLDGAQAAMTKAGFVGDKFTIEAKNVKNDGRRGRPAEGTTTQVFIPRRKYSKQELSNWEKS